MRLDIDYLYNTKKSINNVLQYMNNAKKSMISIKSDNEYYDYIMKIINDIKNVEMIINKNNSWIDETVNKFLKANLLSENIIMNTMCSSKQSNLKPNIGVSNIVSDFANVGRISIAPGLGGGSSKSSSSSKSSTSGGASGTSSMRGPVKSSSSSSKNTTSLSQREVDYREGRAPGYSRGNSKSSSSNHSSSSGGRRRITCTCTNKRRKTSRC